MLAAASPALPQNAPAPQAPSTDSYSTFNVDLFLGYQHFLIDNRDAARVNSFNDGIVGGFRFTEDVWRYVGIEQSLSIGSNTLAVIPFGLSQAATANTHNYTVALNPVFNFTPRESKLRPFVTVGPGFTWYEPAKYLDTSAVPGSIPPSGQLLGHSGVALIYGGGIKYNFSRNVGLRFDVRGLRTQGREFGLPEAPFGAGTVYIPNHSSENAVAVTGGVTFRFGHRGDYVPPQPQPKPPEAPKPVANVQIGGVAGARDVCPGESVRLEVTASGWLPDQTPSYQWMINGQPVSGATGSTFNVPTGGSGASSVTVQVSAPGSSATSNPVTVRVNEVTAPTVQFALSQTSIPYGSKLPLHATATAGPCGGPATVRYTASQGTITGDVFDSSPLSFDQSNRLKQQTQVVHLTAIATGQNGGSGNASADLTVTLSPEARRLDDIVFPANSARVNNCAKRLLMEQLTPLLRDDPNATVILIGHRDEREKGKAASKLDTVRTLNSAAVLSAGTGICPMLELSRVKVNWVGTDQTSATRPLFCGTSTDVKERNGQSVKSTDPRAQFRRVEVWIVPGGAAMPAGVSGLQDVPAADVKKLGCPK
jgi:outer membrane protein OmpA-like peptidoglycan-associated protein/opacity protein-like surface antigen